MPKRDAIPDSPADITPGALTIPWGEANWACACSQHAERPMLLYPFRPVPEGELGVLKGDKLFTIAAERAGEAIEVTPEDLEAGIPGARILEHLPPAGATTATILRPGVGVLEVAFADVRPEDDLLAGRPVRKPNGEPVYIGDAPGFQEDCLACAETVELLIDHMLRVEHDRKTAERFHAREMRRMARDLGIGPA
jgi:hypothetical protein